MFVFSFQVVQEPVEEWTRVPATGGSTLNLLDKFYQDPEKYAYTFQNYVFMSRVMQVRRDAGQAQPDACAVQNPNSLRAARADVCRPLCCTCARRTSVCVSCRSVTVPTLGSPCV